MRIGIVINICSYFDKSIFVYIVTNPLLPRSSGLGGSREDEQTTSKCPLIRGERQSPDPSQADDLCLVTLALWLESWERR